MERCGCKKWCCRAIVENAWNRLVERRMVRIDRKPHHTSREPYPGNHTYGYELKRCRTVETTGPTSLDLMLCDVCGPFSNIMQVSRTLELHRRILWITGNGNVQCLSLVDFAKVLRLPVRSCSVYSSCEPCLGSNNSYCGLCSPKFKYDVIWWLFRVGFRRYILARRCAQGRQGFKCGKGNSLGWRLHGCQTRNRVNRWVLQVSLVLKR